MSSRKKEWTSAEVEEAIIGASLRWRGSGIQVSSG